MKLPYDKNEFLDRKQEFINQCEKRELSYNWNSLDASCSLNASLLDKITTISSIDYLYNQTFFDGRMKRFSFTCMCMLSVPLVWNAHLKWFFPQMQMHVKHKSIKEYPDIIERGISEGFKIRSYLKDKTRVRYLIHPKFIVFRKEVLLASYASYPQGCLLVISTSHYESINCLMKLFYDFDRDFLI